MSTNGRKGKPVEQRNVRTEVRTFEQFRAEADRAEPYPLDLGGEVIEIPPPDTTEQVFTLSENGHKPREALKALCGEYYERVYSRLKGEHISVFNGLVADMAAHFGMGSAPSGPGGN
ncbi:hypothetical protein E1161_13345 [Saccharopolyspora aridisoli]|uniref:Uncharacterized protein n=1 Tax=Saccharopolyspora aridisoli TaxID=2530385 RepID=A0A4R4UUJ6_9PSEU|nr:hypothetical protein [Saccharopolyspora aridisoli]TDC92353.1 hypothetical protein E1161_13345 [Saccharopolyspora aridisoli]